MRNKSLQVDFNNLRGEQQINQILDEAERYIEFLEGKEDRLTSIENTLNEVSESDITNKAEFLQKFEGFKNA
jgi:hypothetical protein